MNTIMCTSKHCPYKNRCYRATKGDSDDINQSYVNLEYTCNENSGFDMYIPVLSD